MKYCIYCGAEAQDNAAFCVRCGRSLADSQPVQAAVSPAKPMYDEALVIIVKIFLILGCLSQCWLLLPLLWCIPLTVSVFNSFRDGRPIGTGAKVCVLLFVNLIAGICLLVMNENA